MDVYLEKALGWAETGNDEFYFFIELLKNKEIPDIYLTGECYNEIFETLLNGNNGDFLLEFLKIPGVLDRLTEVQDIDFENPTPYIGVVFKIIENITDPSSIFWMLENHTDKSFLDDVYSISVYFDDKQIIKYLHKNYEF